jgi:hypothetical protein
MTNPQLSDEAVRDLYNRLRPFPSESDVSECLKELLELRAENAGFRHDIERSMANHVADLNSPEMAAAHVPNIESKDISMPREFQDGAHWVIQTDYPDYAAAGDTAEEARLNFWKGLAMTFWERDKRGFRLDGVRTDCWGFPVNRRAE